MSTSIVLERENATIVSRAADYVELTKPRIAVLILVIVAISGYVARWGQPGLWPIVNALFGTLLVAASASALNQLFEQSRDLLMERTADRPLPAGRLTAWQVLLFASVTGILGTVHLAVTLNWLTAAFAVATWIVYVLVYTPLKSVSAWNTAVGAVSGALPVLIGWSAVEGTFSLLDPRGLVLFAVLFLWQFPHFMAIAWIYRKQYDRAGLQMLTVVDPSGRRAGIQAVLAALALLPISFIPALVSVGYGSPIYLIAAFVLGGGQLWYAIRFFVRRDEQSARWLLRASLVYLPALFAFLVFTTLV